MTLARKIILGFVVVFFILWCIIAFLSNNPNLLMWPVPVKVIWLGLGAFVGCGTAAIIEEEHRKIKLGENR